MAHHALSSDYRVMKSWIALIVLLSVPALVAAQESCSDKTSTLTRAERAAPVTAYPAWSQWVLVEPQFL